MYLSIRLHPSEMQCTDKWIAIVTCVMTFCLACAAGTGTILGRWLLEDWGLNYGWPETFWTSFGLTGVALLFLVVIGVNASMFLTQDKRWSIAIRVVISVFCCWALFCITFDCWDPVFTTLNRMGVGY